jgi:hypothetical protein
MVTRLIRIGADWNYEFKIMNTSDVLTGGNFVLFNSNNNNWFKIDYGNTRMALKTENIILQKFPHLSEK